MTNEGYLSEDEVRSLSVFEAQLAAVDLIMKELARRHGLKLVGNFRGEWPARGLQKRRWVTYHRVSICLNPDYLSDGKVYYLLSDNSYSEWWLGSWHGKALGYNRIAEYSVEQVNDRELMKRDIEKLW